MAGELVPLVLLPRYTTYCGATDFTTIAMEVADYAKAHVSVWRGPMIGTGPTFTVVFQESTDQLTWTTCNNGTGGDPGSGSEAQYTPELNKRWFRIKVTLGGTDPVGSCWAIGFLELRES